MAAIQMTDALSKLIARERRSSTIYLEFDQHGECQFLPSEYLWLGDILTDDDDDELDIIEATYRVVERTTIRHIYSSLSNSLRPIARCKAEQCYCPLKLLL